MLNIHVIICRLGLMLLFTSFGVPATASEVDIQWTPQATKGGFMVNLPVINNNALIDEIITLKIDLMHDKKLLAQLAEEKRFKDKDSLLSILLPGGLLYAAYKKNAHAEAVQAYEQAFLRLKEITTDIAALMVIDGPILVAQAR